MTNKISEQIFSLEDYLDREVRVELTTIVLNGKLKEIKPFYYIFLEMEKEKWSVPFLGYIDGIKKITYKKKIIYSNPYIPDNFVSNLNELNILTYLSFEKYSIPIIVERQKLIKRLPFEYNLLSLNEIIEKVNDIKKRTDNLEHNKKYQLIKEMFY